MAINPGNQAVPSAQKNAGGLIERLIEWWALLGGALLVVVVLMNVVSIVGGALFNKPFPGDFEMTEVGIAVAAFAFLPYCQLKNAHVTADIFTSKLRQFWIDLFGLAAALVGLVFALLLLWRMFDGMLDQKAYGYTTAILQFPHWIAFIPILISLALWALAAFMSLRCCFFDVQQH